VILNGSIDVSRALKAPTYDPPGFRTYNSLASACSRGHAWLEASKLLTTAADQGLPWDLFSYNIAIQVQKQHAEIYAMPWDPWERR
jgi:hypothetical protein